MWHWVFVLAITFLLWQLLYRLLLRPLFLIYVFRKQGIQGKWIPIWGIIPKLLKELKYGHFFDNYIQEMDTYGGDIWYSSLGPQVYLNLNKPEFVADVLNYKSKFYKKQSPKDKNKEIFGNGISNAAGMQWKRQRKVLGPTFKYNVIKESIAGIRKEFARSMEKLEKTLDCQDLNEEMNFCSFQIIAQILFGGSFLEDFLARYQVHPFVAFKIFADRLAKHKAIWAMFFPENYRSIPVPQNFALNKEIKLFREAAKMAIQRRLENKTFKWEQLSDDMDFLDTVISNTQLKTHRLSSTDPKYLNADRPMDEDEMVDQVMNFIVAGFAPTGIWLPTLVMCLYLYPEQYDILVKEMKEVFSSNNTLDYEDQLLRLTKMTNFLKEVLRIYPPAPESEFKIAIQDHYITDGIKKYFIPAGTRIKISAYGTQINKRWWDNPDEFQPERFNSQGFHPYAFLAFGAGPRVCLGKNYALMIGKIFLVEFLRKFKVIKVNKPKFVSKIFMMPLEPIAIKVEKVEPFI